MVRQTNLWDAESAAYLAAGKVDLPHWWIGLGKLAELVCPAIHECLVAASPESAERVVLLLAVAATNRPHRWPGLDEEILDEVEVRLGVRFHPSSKVFDRGSVSCGLAMQEAEQLLSRSEVSYCIVAGADSLVRQDVVVSYLQDRRILTPLNSNGFSPGEAGAACLVGKCGADRRGVLQILATEMSKETATPQSTEPCRGDGLTLGYRKALAAAGLSFSEVDYRVADLNGEHSKFKEAALAAAREDRHPTRDYVDIWHPVEYLGEIGAAVGPCALAWVLDAGRRAYAPGPTALLHFGNDDGDRCVVVTKYIEGSDE